MPFSPRKRVAVAAAALLFASALLPATAAQTPGAPPLKLLPPPGIAVPEGVRAALAAGLADLARDIETLRADLKGKPALLARLPDVQIYEKAVRRALEDNEFFKPAEFETAKQLLAQGRERAAALRAGATPWLEKPGLVALGYVSRIDGSVQPYGLVVPLDWTAGDRTKRRLDFFFHGRGEQLTELSFIDQRQKSPGEFTPEGAFVLHPYGRFCNANHLAGEVDLFEALEDVKTRYAVDDDRVVIRGFSMGGAACWHFAVHHASLWAAAAPGAGFAETPRYSNLLAPGRTPPPWYEQKLWHLYDATDYAVNLAQLPTVAYSGEIDRQKQAADVMAEAVRAEGLELPHVIGPQTGHKYHPDSKKEINAFVDAAAAKGREKLPARVRFTTWTLRYPVMNWVRVEGMGEHWERARVDATFADGAVTATTENVTALVFDRPDVRAVTLDGQKLAKPAACYIRDPKTGRWRGEGAEKPGSGPLRKRPGLQGPIDDAFLGSFVFVRPTGTPLNPAVGEWTKNEMERAARAWRKFFRGEVRVVDDTAVTDDLSRSANLILWGDPKSNRFLARVAGKLPLRWDASAVRVGDQTYTADAHVPVLVYPNPAAPGRYLVVNSGPTFIHQMAGSNALHIPHLPDWAVKRIGGMGSGVADAGFFDEAWRFKPRPAAAAGE